MWQVYLQQHEWRVDDGVRQHKGHDAVSAIRALPDHKATHTHTHTHGDNNNRFDRSIMVERTVTKWCEFVLG